MEQSVGVVLGFQTMGHKIKGTYRSTELVRYLNLTTFVSPLDRSLCPCNKSWIERAVVVAQFVELLITQVRGLNPVIDKKLWILNICLLSTVYWKDENKEKESVNGPFLKQKLNKQMQVSRVCKAVNSLKQTYLLPTPLNVWNILL